MEQYEPRREKTRFLHMRKQRCRSACSNREADQRLCFRYIDSTIPLLPKSKISSLYGSEIHLREVPINVKSLIVTS